MESHIKEQVLKKIWVENLVCIWAQKNLPDEKTDSEKRMNMKDSMGKTKGLSSLNLDLFADYGFGIQAWIRMLLNLFCLYAFLSIFAGCIMMLY